MFELANMRQGEQESAAEFFDRVDILRAQAEVSKNFMSGIIIGALVP